MKTLVTLIFALFFAFAANAQDRDMQEVQKVATIEMGLVQLTELPAPAPVAGEVARLYRRSNSRVEKELFFATKKDFQMA